MRLRYNGLNSKAKSTMKNTPLKHSVPLLTEAERKQCEEHAANTPSPNLNEAVEKSIVKKSSDEARAKPN